MSARLKESDLIELSRLINKGFTYEQISKTLYLSRDGVYKRIKILCRELGVDTRQQALRRARHLGWLNNEDQNR